ncbi:hypothetical protein [Streptomyces sp. S.PNR 29]|uniref:hypothetical protein n=1 Tax=Streptomyces sp. S.PNR 29 TaxID=2973805 RepID=UPI0025AF896F|nr:hypothetical protein [Streptomyces sp. S.PNR 29]MDN0195460.1 hypothetical protein [Streptomyces sp. S.PNR 29]
MTVDWDAPCTDGPSPHWVGRWTRDSAGALVRREVTVLPGEVYGAAETAFGEGNIAPSRWPADGELPLGDDIYRPVVPTYGDLVPAHGPWQPVWDVMRTLSGLHGGENVRIVVWFGG